MRMTSKLTVPALAAAAATGLLLNYFVGHRRPQSTLHKLQHEVEDHLPAAAALGFVAALAVGGVALSRRRGRQGSPHFVHESIELDVPVSTAYNQWTQFEEFPRFMATVQEVRQIDDTHLQWRANVAGKTKEWRAEITEQIPDQRIQWRSTGGVHNAGAVTFHKLSDSRCRIDLQMEYSPETAIERVGGAVGGVKLTTMGNLQRFKQLIESRGQETGAWRGTVPAQ
jgi:uncharacterized membrane protein